MAIGDNTNQNLFGTNYNAEEEERKKAELAAQGAMMGAGNVPASAFGQAPAVNPFSMEAAGQVNPMMQAQSLEAPASAPNPVTFLPYADDVSTPRASALSVFTPGGEVKPDVDVNAITPSPETTSTSAVNTALNQEVAVGSPNIDSPEESVRLARFRRPRTGESSQNVVLDFLSSTDYGETRRGTRAPSVESALGETQFTSPNSLTFPSETVGQVPSVNAFSTENAGQVNPMMEAQSLEATQGEATVTPPTQTLSQFMRYEDAPEQRTEQFVDAQGRLRFRPTQEALRLQAQGEVAQPPVDSAVPAATTQPSTGPVKVPDEIMSQVARPSGQTAEFRDGNRDGIEDREQGIFRPGELIGYDAQGNEVRSPETQQPVNRIPASSQPPVDALSSFEQDSLSRQQRIGGTGSFAGDSEAREARLREMDRRPGESQADRDTRVAQSKTTSGQTGGLSFDDARRRAEGQLAARGVKNPSASQVNALARGIQAGEPERLAELETQKAINEAKLKTAQATLDRPEFEGKVYTVNGVTFAQTSRGGAQVIDTGTETPQESTAQMKDFVFTLEQIDKAREAFAAGDVDKANDIITAAGIQKNGFDVTASEYFGGLTQQQEANITRQAFDTMEEAEAANLPEGTKITIGGRNATV